MTLYTNIVLLRELDGFKSPDVICIETYLDRLHQPVAELQSSRCCWGAKGCCPPLETSDDASIFSILLNGQPEEIPHSVDWRNTQKRKKKGEWTRWWKRRCKCYKLSLWLTMCFLQSQTTITHIAGQQSAWGQHLQECPAADSSWCLSATLLRHTGSLCRHRGG